MPTAWCRHCDAAIASAKHVWTCMPELTASEQMDALLERVAEGTVSPSQGTAIIAKFIVRLVDAVKANAPVARSLDEWHEDDGEALWWKFPVVEAPYVGSPLNEDFPDYVTHWTAIAAPSRGPVGESS